MRLILSPWPTTEFDTLVSLKLLKLLALRPSEDIVNYSMSEANFEAGTGEITRAVTILTDLKISPKSGRWRLSTWELELVI